MADTTCGICGYECEDEDELNIHLPDCEAAAMEAADDDA